MDSQRFEDLTRGLATARSRRDLVKALFGGLITGGGAVAAQRSGALAQTPCEDDAGCAEGEICCAGFCRAIECCIDEADPNARCPEGTSCFEGLCTPIDEPGACASDDECGDGEICCAGACRELECCINDADPNARCPEGTSCFEGICDPIVDDGDPDAPVDQLPETGVGPGAASTPPMLSALLSGAAAAAAALGIRAKRKRPAKAEDASQ